ncbi:hypothetical protein ACNKHX_13935 [Shigella flexneri]
MVLDEAKIGVASMPVVGTVGRRSWFADENRNPRVVCWLVNRWYTAVGLLGSGTSKTVLTRYATVLNRVCECRRSCQWAMCRGGAVRPLSAEENHSGKEYDGSKTRRT